MSNNFSGNVRKNADSFKQKSSSGGVRYAGVGKPVDDAGIGRVIGGVFAGQDTPVVFEKADSPTLTTDPAPNAGHRGEKELGVSVDRVDRDGGAEYTDPASIIRQTIARLSGVSGTHSAVAALQALADQLDGKSGKAASGDMHKSASQVEVECPHCHGANHVERSSFGGLQKITCGSCGKGWQQDVSISTFTKSSASPDTAGLQKQLNELNYWIEKLRTSIAQRSGVVSTGSSGSGRFVSLGTGEQRNRDAAAREAMTKSLANGVNIDKLVRG